MENIDSLFKMQRAHYTSAQAYDTFCDELENYLPYVFGLTKSFSELEPDVDDARKLLRSTITPLSFQASSPPLPAVLP